MNSSGLDSIVSSSVQMAPCASQSSVAGSSTVTSALESGLTLISHRMLGVSLSLSSRRAPTTVPLVTVNAWSRSVTSLKPSLGSSLKRSSKVKSSCPSCEPGASWMAAVSAVAGVSLLTARPLKEEATLPCVSRMKSGPLGLA